MEFIRQLFGTLMAYIYNGISALGPEPKSISYFALTILIFTALFKILTFPITLKSMKMNEVNQKMQPEIEKLKKKYGHDPQTLNRKMMELQKEMGFNPLAGCLPMLVPIILIWALFGVMREPHLYMFHNGGFDTIARNFFWIKDLSLPDPLWYGLPLINGLTQFVLANMSMVQPDTTQKDNPGAGMNMMLKYFMPVMIFWFARTYISGLALYWAFSNIVEIIMRLIVKVAEGK